MKITFDLRDMEREHTRSTTVVFKSKQRAKIIIRRVSVLVRDRVANQMPIDTGAAVYRWGNPTASDGIWIESDDGMSIEQGAGRVPYEYISRLNEGWSRQAPAGFIDVIAQQAAEDLAEEMLGMMVEEI